LSTGVWQPNGTKSGFSTICFHFQETVKFTSKQLLIYENFKAGNVTNISISGKNDKMVEIFSQEVTKFPLLPRAWAPEFSNGVVYSTDKIYITMCNTKLSQIAGIKIISNETNFEHQINLQHMDEIKDNHLFWDMKIIHEISLIEKESIPCHKIVLSKIPKFQKFLLVTDEIEIKGFSKKTICSVLDYLYHGKTHIEDEDEVEFICFGEIYGITEGISKIQKSLSIEKKVEIISTLMELDHPSVLYYVKNLDLNQLLLCKCLNKISQNMIFSIHESKKIMDQNVFIDFLILWGKCQYSYLVEKKTMNEVLKPFLEKISFVSLSLKKLKEIHGMYPDLIKFDLNTVSKQSSIATDLQMNQLKFWIAESTKSSDVELSIIYRGSNDGFSSVSFHKNCDSCSQSLVVVRCKDNYIFGGFAGTNWKGNNSFSPSTVSFLYSLTNPYNDIFFMPAKPNSNEHIGKQECSGPIFGSGYDLIISSLCNKNSKSNFAGFPYCYEMPKNFKGSHGSKLFTGDAYFQVGEIEVFEVILK
jgi:hypothetical protein